MSFNNEARKVKNEKLGVGLRYISLRHCVEHYCPLGFNRTWSRLENRFGLKEGQRNNPEVLLATIDFLVADRQAWLMFVKSRRELIQSRVAAGFPKPTINGRIG